MYEMELLEKIHAGIDRSCYGAILKSWEIDDEAFSKSNMKMKQEIYSLHQNGLSNLDIAKKKNCSPGTIGKNLREYVRLLETGMMLESDHAMYDRLFAGKSFINHCKHMIDKETEDTYFSLNSFYKAEKKSSTVRHINAFVLDFDFYKINRYSKYSPEDFYKNKIKHLLPIEPTAVVDSGRGLYVIYTFEHCSYHMTKLYKSIMKYFYERYKGYGVDKLALNVTQVIRLPGSLNTRNLKVVKILEFNDTKYKIQDFAKLLPYERGEVLSFKELKECDKKTVFLPTINFSRKKYFNDFLDDIKKVITLKQKNGQITGYREMLIYLLRERATWSGYTINESVQIAKQCNSLFSSPLTDRDIEIVCRPSSKRMKSSISTIIDKLEITDDMQRQLKVLRELKLKKSSYAKRKRKHALSNRTKKEAIILERRTLVCYLKYQKHKSNREIADITEVNKATITRDLTYIASHPAEFKIALEEHLKQMDAYSNSAAFKNKITYDVQMQMIEWLKVGYDTLSLLFRDVGDMLLTT